MSESILHLPALPADHRLFYGDDSNQFADLRLPGESGPHPAIIAIHGGYWRAHYDLTHLGHFCQALTNLGCATWSLEYRRVGEPGGGWPGTFLDIANGAALLFEIAEDYDIDPTRVIVVGHSAGGHLALWLGGRARIPSGSPIAGDSLPLRAAVSLAGVVDLARAWQMGLSDHAVGGLLGGSPAEVPERYAAASPAALLPLGVRQILIHGTADDAVPSEISVAYHASATALGDDVLLLTLPDIGHFELIDPASFVWPRVAATILAQT